jgi:hypothetical protein
VSAVDDAVHRIHDVIQGCMNDGLLEPGMLTDWYLVAASIDRDGDACSFMLADSEATVPRSLGLVDTAHIALQLDVIRWLDDE